jgi:hypothetical protein
MQPKGSTGTREIHIPKRSAAGVDGQTVEAAKKSFDEWIEPMLQSIHSVPSRTITVSSSFRDNVIRAGLNYKFDWH